MASNDRSNGYVILLDAPRPAGFAERRKWDMLSRQLSVDTPVADAAPQGDTVSGSAQQVAPTGRPQVPPPDGDTARSDITVSSPKSVTSTPVDSMTDVSLDARKSAYSVPHAARIDDPSLILAPATGGSSTTARGTDSLIDRHRIIDGFHGMPSNRCYTMNWTIKEEVPQALQSECGAESTTSTLHLIVDTGSDTSWVIGCNCHALVDTDDGERVVNWTKLRYQEVLQFDEAHLQRRQSTGSIDHSYRLVTRPNSTMQEWRLDDDAVVGRIRYNNTMKALITLTKKAVPVTIGDSYNFDKRSWTARLIVPFSFGVAYAATSSLYRRTSHGVLGLGILPYQPDFAGSKETGHPISFGVALSGQHLIPAQSAEGGPSCLIYYFVLRQLMKHGYSFLALNIWPCVDETGAPVVPDWSHRIPLVPKANHWSICALSFLFECYDKHSKKWNPVSEGPYSLGTGGEGVTVVIDSSCTLSWLPAGLIRHIRQKVFITGESGEANKVIQEEHGDNPSAGMIDDSPPFYGPSETDVWQVKVTFKGADGPVTVKLPVDPFVCTWNPARGKMEGLLCVPPWQEATYILGTNFFNAAFVALHNVSPGDPSRAYVKVAPQWPEQRARFKAPPL
ncbi:hypothetical protein BD413DRAFT_564530 [Trametes elegans]|nr:hypothetical protein BD413DRAFT_564530 [Trametes elegans]